MRWILTGLLWTAGVLPGVLAAATPPVRAITAFVELDPARYALQLAQTAAGLQRAQALFERAGFTVQTVRITTQPFMQYLGGMDRAHALALLDHLEELGRQNKVLIDIGPAVLDDRPDPRRWPSSSTCTAAAGSWMRA
jgi:hypothetical protein